MFPHLSFIFAVVAVLFIAGGRIGKLWPIAVAGFALLALAAVLALTG